MNWRDHEDDEFTRLGRESMGRLVQRLRRRAGLTQRQAQQRSGVHQSVICRLERGQRCGITLRRFLTLIGALGGVDPPPEPARLRWTGFRGADHPDP